MRHRHLEARVAASRAIGNGIDGQLVNRTSDRLFAIATRILRDSNLAEDGPQSTPHHRLARASRFDARGLVR